MARTSALRREEGYDSHLDVAVEERKDAPGVWVVEAIDYDNEGTAFVTTFGGPDAELRAREYATFKYGV